VLRKCFSLAGVVVVSSSPMPTRSARDNSVADSSCVEFDLSASIVLDSRVHKYALISLRSVPGFGFCARSHFKLFALSIVFSDVVPSFFVIVTECTSSCLIV
jgi:hypothetical protein